ncbi:MAG: response regulator [Bryobacteraceae bacterium]
MTTILLADESPHARRMGETILRQEGYQVVVAGDGDTALGLLAETDPYLLIADAFLPQVDGLTLCREAKARMPHLRVIVTAGMLKSFDEASARAQGADATLRKPFEASVMAGIVRPLVEESMQARRTASDALPVQEAEKVRLLVTKAVEAEIPRLIDEITRRVIKDLGR